jgi:alginate O-acetyltransferase complex protein AlgI
MLFNSLHFLLFLPVVVLLYYFFAQRFRWILIFIASCYFYMAFVPEYILILFLIIIIDYFSALKIERAQGRKRKAWLLFSLLSNILLLSFFKYFNFLNNNLHDLGALIGFNFHPVNLSIILPIGLSFHTFQSMSYTFEVYRKRQKAERHVGYFANYVLFFPQMVAGPIERYENLGLELRKNHPPLYENFANGFRLILFGLFVKMTIADNIAPYVNEVYKDPATHPAFEVWMAVVLFSFQIYADFYGYSTIAVGCARLLGIRIMDNFRTPYLSHNISEFWSRWHISLSTWFRDYVYIPLGGNRVNLLKWSFNIMVVFVLSGLWHGANWTFVVWGALHGLLMLLQRYYGLIFKKDHSSYSGFIGGLRVVWTFILTSFIWIFFRSEDFGKAKEVICAMFNSAEIPSAGLDLRTPLFFCMLLLLSDVFFYESRVDHKMAELKPVYRWTVYSVVLFLLFALSGMHKFVFIYFQF